MTLYKGAKVQLINQLTNKLEDDGCQRIFEVLELSPVDYETKTCLVRLKEII